MNLTGKIPMLFLGHGNPLNAIEENEFVKGFRNEGKIIPRPKAILCISAHWETKGTLVTAMEKPRTIHDFGGFPQVLYEVQYPAFGSPELAELIKQSVKKTEIGLDYSWGLDHGCWSVVRHFFPEADIPVIQISLDFSKGPLYHYELAKELSFLRSKDILIVGSGNIVHNLGILDWKNHKGGYEWAHEANEKIKRLILSNDHDQLINYKKIGKEMALAVPSPEHYLPMLYILGLKEESEKVSFFNDKIVLGSISMTSFMINNDSL